MKKVIGLFLFMGFVSTAQAQENVSFGPVLGITSAKLRGDIGNTKAKTGLTTGLFLNYSIESRFGLQGQLLYTQLGTAYTNGLGEINLNYLQLPILATFFLNDRGNPFRPKLFIGPHVGALLTATNENGGTINGDANNRAYKGLDAGLTMGGGFNARLNPKIWLNADVRYGLGLVDVTHAASNLNNRNWGFNFGISFPLGRYEPGSGQFSPSR